MSKLILSLSIFCLAILLTACNTDKPALIEALTIENEREIANRIHQLIQDDENHTILDADDYPAAYTYLSNHLKDLTLSPLVTHGTDYNWSIFIFDNDDASNAFTTPGGYIYFDSGLLKYLTSEAEFIGLLSNEISYADLGFVTQKLENQYGMSLLLDLALGSNFEDSGELLNAFTDPFSTAFVEEADAYMLALTCEMDYDLEEIANFLGRAYNTCDWLATHASKDIEPRIASISDYACNNAAIVADSTYQTELLDNL